MHVVGPGYAFFETDDCLFVVDPRESRAVSTYPNDPDVLCCYLRRDFPPEKQANVTFELAGWVTSYDDAEIFLKGKEPEMWVGVDTIYEVPPPPGSMNDVGYWE